MVETHDDQTPPDASNVLAVCWEHSLGDTVCAGAVLGECIQVHTTCMHSVCTPKRTEIDACVSCWHGLETSFRVLRSLGIVMGDVKTHS